MDNNTGRRGGRRDDRQYDERSARTRGDRPVRPPARPAHPLQEVFGNRLIDFSHTTFTATPEDGALVLGVGSVLRYARYADQRPQDLVARIIRVIDGGNVEELVEHGLAYTGYRQELPQGRRDRDDNQDRPPRQEPTFIVLAQDNPRDPWNTSLHETNEEINVGDLADFMSETGYLPFVCCRPDGTFPHWGFVRGDLVLSPVDLPDTRKFRPYQVRNSRR